MIKWLDTETQGQMTACYKARVVDDHGEEMEAALLVTLLEDGVRAVLRHPEAGELAIEEKTIPELVDILLRDGLPTDVEEGRPVPEKGQHEPEIHRLRDQWGVRRDGEQAAGRAPAEHQGVELPRIGPVRIPPQGA